MHSWSLSLNAVARLRFWAPNDQLLRILIVQKRHKRLMLEVRLLDNSVQMFQKLQWLPSDRIIREKTLCMMFKTLNKECLDYSTNYITQVKKIIIAIALNLSIIFSLYRNVGQTLVFKDSMRVRLIYGTVWTTILWTWPMKGTLQNIYSWKSI